MNKYIFIVASLLVFGLADAKADLRESPKGPPQAFATADYGGVWASTMPSFSSSSVLLFTGGGVFQGIIISSYTINTSTDYFIVRDTASINGGSSATTNSLVYATSEIDTNDRTGELFRVHLPTAPRTSDNGAWNGFTWKPPFPVRVLKGLAVRCSAGLPINRITVLFTKDQ